MAQLPITTIPPFNDINQLPACAAACGHLYDANGACVPPAVPTNQAFIYTACFCDDPRVAAFSSTTGGVCDDACTAEPDGLNSITNWFKSICNVKAAPTMSSTTSTTFATSTATRGGSSTSRPIPDGPTGDWMSNHWRWVVMLVILVVGIAGIWIGACIWRRRYIRKRDLKATTATGTAANQAWPSDPANASSGAMPMNLAAKAGAAPPGLPQIILPSEKSEPQGRKWFGS